MEYRTLGRTDIKVSLICLGTMTWGRQNTKDDAFDQMDYALAQGVNFFDTAEMYAVPPSAASQGKTEEYIGAWFAARGRRQDVVLATKVAGPAPHMPWIRGGQARLERAQIIAACDGSLQRLQTDYIDLYQIHWPQRPVNSFGRLGFQESAVTGREMDVILETLETCADLAKAGKIRVIGVSNETPWGVMQYLRAHETRALPRIVAVQNPYSLLNRSYEVGLAEMSMQEGVGLLAYSPLAAGYLTGKYLDGVVPKGTRRDIDTRASRYDKPAQEEATRAYLAIAARHGLDPAQMALAYVHARPFVTSTIIGATSMTQLKTNIDSCGMTLPVAAVAEIEQVHARLSNPCP